MTKVLSASLLIRGTGTVLVFGLAGLLTGFSAGFVERLLTPFPLPDSLAAVLGSLIPGGLFAAGLFGAAHLVTGLGGIHFRPSAARRTIAITGIILAWPAGLYFVVYAIHFFGFAAMVLSAAFGGALVSAAMRVLTKRWAWPSVALLCLAAPLLLQDFILDYVALDSIYWLALGQFMFGLACGYWMFRAFPAPATT